MPYSHFHDWSFHTHRRRPKGGNHWRAVRRRQRPWRIGALVLLVAVIIGTAAVLSVRNDVHTRIMFTLQQGMITPAPTPIDVDEPTERVVAITPSVKPSATAIRTPELVAARDAPPVPTAKSTERPTDPPTAQTPVSATTDIPTPTATPATTSTPTGTHTPIATHTPPAPIFTPTPTVTLTPTVVPVSTPTPEPTATSTAILTATVAPTAEERELTLLGTPPEHMVYAWWD